MSNREKKKFLRMFFATDVHGSTVVFKKFLSAADVYKADVLVLGGDVTGKLIVPIISVNNGYFSANYMEQDWSIKKEELEQFETRIENAGFYTYQTTKDEWNDIWNSSKYDELYEKLAAERVKKWVALAEERFKNNDLLAYVTGGNDDPQWFKEAFTENSRVRNVDDDVVSLSENYQMVSLGVSNRTPWKTPREMDEPDLEAHIDKLISKCTLPPESCIFNFHVPPYDSGLDTCPMVDGSYNPPKYVFKGGQSVMIPAGSTAVRHAIEKYKPVVGLHGHIHEQRAAVKIGRTWCINPGSEYGEGLLRGVVVNLDGGGKGFQSYQFTSG